MAESFPDRRDELFGRESDVHDLLDRARQPGFTAVIARPLMGKTWTLTEVARRLVEERQFLIGYHEAKGGESSHLLYAVSNLYEEWLADSAMREQAISLWERHKAGLVPKAAQLAGALFATLSKAFAPEGVGTIVRDAFSGLVEAQKDLKSGGLQLAPLPYDQALSLTKLVAQISNRRIVLILDAWEKSPSMRHEATTLDSFLKELGNWPPTHILAAVRSPELVGGQTQEPDRIARELCRISRAAAAVELGPMNLESPKERERLAGHLRSKVSAANAEATQDLVDLVAGYPGVVKFWIDRSMTAGIHSSEDLRAEADLAQNLRYLELERLLDGLKEPHATLAARLALFPRLSAETWHAFRDLFVESAERRLVEELTDNKVLEDQPIPTYGHDTRHAAAMRWFLENRTPLARRVIERFVGALASGITGIDAPSRPRYEVLSALEGPGQAANVGRGAIAAVHAAKAAFGVYDGVVRRDFFDDSQLLLRQFPKASTLVAVALLNRGVRNGKRGDADGAIADYTAAIELPGAPADQVASALRGRGFTRGERGDADGAIIDYTAAIELPGATADHVANALRSRGIAKGQRGDTDGAIADYTAAIELPGTAADHVAKALFNRGFTRGECGDADGAIADYTAAIELPGAPADHVANALRSRGFTRGERGDVEDAIADYTAAIELAGAPADQVASALISRGIRKGEHGDTGGEIADYTAAIELPGAPADQVAKALVNRGILKVECGDADGAIVDYTGAIELPGAPPVLVAKALVNRGIAKGERGDAIGEIADYTAAIELPGAPADQVAKALVNRGITKGERGDADGAIADFTATVELPGALTDQVASALRSRGITKHQLGNVDAAIADYTAVIELPGAATDHVARALINRGITKGQLGDTNGAIADFTATIELPGAPAGSVASALFSRGVAKDDRGEADGAIADYAAAIELPGAPDNVVKLARETSAKLVAKRI